MPFADYQEMYRQKLTTADEAVKVIKSGDWVTTDFVPSTPACWMRRWLAAHRSWRM